LNYGKDLEKTFLEHIEGNSWSSSRSLKIGINYMDLGLARWKKIII